MGGVGFHRTWFPAAFRYIFIPQWFFSQHARVESVLSVASSTPGFTSVFYSPNLDTMILRSSGKTHLFSRPFSGDGNSQGAVVHGAFLNFPTGERHEVVSY